MFPMLPSLERTVPPLVESKTMMNRSGVGVFDIKCPLAEKGRNIWSGGVWRKYGEEDGLWFWRTRYECMYVYMHE